MKLREFLDGIEKINVTISHVHEGKQVLVALPAQKLLHTNEGWSSVTFGFVTLPLDAEIGKFVESRIGDEVKSLAVVEMGLLRVVIERGGRDG